jgi:hypothetical protein
MNSNIKNWYYQIKYFEKDYRIIAIMAEMEDEDIITAIGDYGGYLKTEIKSNPSC